MRSVAELARRNPASLHAKLESVHGGGGYPGAPPARERVAEWVAEAKRRTSGS